MSFPPGTFGPGPATATVPSGYRFVSCSAVITAGPGHRWAGTAPRVTLGAGPSRPGKSLAATLAHRPAAVRPALDEDVNNSAPVADDIFFSAFQSLGMTDVASNMQVADYDADEFYIR